jgi:ADP-ribose pyrophosphatase
MHSIIIADSLINDICSPESQFQQVKLHVGTDEIGRLLGEGEEYGSGVLPTFLQQAVDIKNTGSQIGLIMLRDYRDPSDPAQEEELLRYGEHSLAGTRGVEFIEPLQDIALQAEILNAPTMALPLKGFQKVLKSLTGLDPLQSSKKSLQQVRFLLVGFHTERRIFSTANILRNVLGFRRVAVTPHLMGSANRDAHFAALRYYFPEALIRVIPELSEAAKYVGMDPKLLERFSLYACAITPENIRGKLNAKQRMIVETLCMHWTRSELKELKGGFSGSFLFLANGWKDKSHTEPMVIKIDTHLPIRKELKGYERVKDLLGKHVPTFTPPVSFGDFTGIGMELATMEGAPATLQDLFENASDDESLGRFIALFKRTISLLVNKVYENTLREKRYVPYRQFWLHIDKQAVWLKENLESIRRQKIADIAIDTGMVENTFNQVRKNDDGIIAEMCLSHGDLNLANIICDNRENIWVIDWTHAGAHPLELDFTKLENDIKFVMSKQVEPEDFPKLQVFEEYLLSHPIPAELVGLPESLRFVHWDLRFKKILLAVKQIREAFFSIKKEQDWLVYRIALLKYGIHTLSFDKSRNRGECGPVQLWYALSSVDNLLFQLVLDEFHLQIRGERPGTYPPRFRIFLDKAKWEVPCPEYAPPYHVEQEVLENDRANVANGWADPEDVRKIPEQTVTEEELSRDEEGRPLNPHGRTGIAGRGALGRWGANPIVMLILTRLNPETKDLEILLHEKDEGDLQLPENFVNFGQSPEEVAKKHLLNETGISEMPQEKHIIHEGYLYDPRQTDHAWLRATGYLLHLSREEYSSIRREKESRSMRWKTLNPELINQFLSSHALLLREAVQCLLDQKLITNDTANFILKQTG